MFRPITFQSYKDIAYNCANKIITWQRTKTHLQIDLKREAILNHFIMWTTSTLHLHHQRETEISTHKIKTWYRKKPERLGKINWRLSMLWSSAYFHRCPHCKFSIIISIKIWTSLKILVFDQYTTLLRTRNGMPKSWSLMEAAGEGEHDSKPVVPPHSLWSWSKKSLI